MASQGGRHGGRPTVAERWERLDAVRDPEQDPTYNELVAMAHGRVGVVLDGGTPNPSISAPLVQVQLYWPVVLPRLKRALRL